MNDEASVTYILSFQFRGRHYELEDGLALGSPLSPAVANIFMARLEERALEQFSPRPSMWFRFVDDVFSIVKRHAVDSLLKHLNNQHPSIQFTREMEESGKLPFLDLAVKRCEGGTLATSVYRKPTHSGRYLNFKSNAPDSVKRSVAASLFHRLDYITTGEEEKKKEEQRIITDLEANDFSRPFIDKVRLLTKRNKVAPTSKPEESLPISTAAIPDVRGVSEAIARVLRQVDIRTVATSKHRKWDLMIGAKDKLPSETLPGVVYALGCQECPRIYIGETGRTAKKRAEEHESHVRKGNTDMSAVAHHVVNTGHCVHWQPRVIMTETNTRKRKVREALVIHRLGPDKVMNLDKRTELSSLWLDLVRK